MPCGPPTKRARACTTWLARIAGIVLRESHSGTNRGFGWSQTLNNRPISNQPSLVTDLTTCLPCPCWHTAGDQSHTLPTVNTLSQRKHTLQHLGFSVFFFYNLSLYIVCDSVTSVRTVSSPLIGVAPEDSSAPDCCAPGVATGGCI